MTNQESDTGVNPAYIQYVHALAGYFSDQGREEFMVGPTDGWIVGVALLHFEKLLTVGLVDPQLVTV